MKIYLDDNRADKRLARLLAKGGHEVATPIEAGIPSASDARHLEYAIRHGFLCMTNDSDDFRELHTLVRTSGGHHPGILLIRFERNSRKNMKPGQVLAAISKLIASGSPCTDEIIVLNHWQ